ncbi:hypothetical protein [Pedobacter alluvionis]|uniref:Class IIb bacteriocin, lactobin A/cerein 7B family n=1 Tax=Pedobacter alluvionis TaxID=475253 RepID=A0A497Y9N9_9SPHI|nr:hypothetical protein [Pedobacter alluvionis]RLJ77009.1 hypothetical protein BCL90_2069 [Pedobacter alluvionis]TFB33745.1 hypothetical protein E3V97_06780 [Pedobacter alluvionis]
MKSLNKISKLNSIKIDNLKELSEQEIIETNGGILGLLGLVVGATALSYQLFKFGWDAGVAAAK